MAFVALSRSFVLKPSFSRLASTVNSAVFQKFGNPSSVLKIQKTQLKDVSKTDVQICMESSSVTSFDTDIIYGKTVMDLPFPCIAGNEGVGVVEEVGSEVRTIKPKDTVMVIKPYLGTWTEKMIVPETSLLRIPMGISSNTAASLLNTAGIAYRLLTDFNTLMKDDIILQTDANSPVGKSVIQMCKRKGIKTINLIKDEETQNGTLQTLQDLGGDLFFKESDVDGDEMKMMLKQIGNSPKLVLNGSGGCIMTKCLPLLKNTAVITYGESSNESFQIDGKILMNNVVFKGFDMNKWLIAANKAEVKDMIDMIAIMLNAGELKMDVENNSVSKILENVEKGAICC